MNEEQIKGKAEQAKGKIKQLWGRLTDDEVALYHGKSDEFFSKVKEKYGVAKEEAEKQLGELDKENAKYTSDRAA